MFYMPGATLLPPSALNPGDERVTFPFIISPDVHARCRPTYGACAPGDRAHTRILRATPTRSPFPDSHPRADTHRSFQPFENPVVFDLWGYWADDADRKCAWPEGLSVYLNGHAVPLQKREIVRVPGRTGVAHRGSDGPATVTRWVFPGNNTLQLVNVLPILVRPRACDATRAHDGAADVADLPLSFSLETLLGRVRGDGPRVQGHDCCARPASVHPALGHLGSRYVSGGSAALGPVTPG